MSARPTPTAATPPARLPRARARGVDWPLAVPVGAAVGLALMGVREGLGVPTVLVAWTGVLFAVWSLVYWGVVGARGATVYARVAGWLAPWALMVAVVLGLAWQVDGAGWLWYRLTGYNLTPAESAASAADLSRAAFVDRWPAFVADPSDATVVRLPAGPHGFARTVVVPRGVSLVIEPGAELRFGAGRSLIAYGAVEARGTADRPIVFTARHRALKWGSVAVIDAPPSVFAHVRFEHARQARVDGVDLTGGLSLVGTDAEIAHSTFGPMFGKDAIYVRGGTLRIHDNEVRDAFIDGIDFDGGRGVLRDNRFVDCGDEGIDLSGDLALDVFDNTVLDRRGGRVAAEPDALATAIVLRNTLGYTDPSHP